MARAGAGEVLVSDLTRTFARGTYLEFEEIGVVELRGLGEPLRLHFGVTARLILPPFDVSTGTPRGNPFDMAYQPDRSVAVAESCTGGLVMARIVATPGSGDWFKGGVVAYHRDVKFDLLGVAPGPVVTAQAAAEMAQGVRLLFGTDLGVSTTGEAGPTPEEEVPIGTVFVGMADGEGARVFRALLSDRPEVIRDSVTDMALERIERWLGPGSGFDLDDPRVPEQEGGST